MEIKYLTPRILSHITSKRFFHDTRWLSVKRKYPINRSLEEDLPVHEYTRSNEGIRSYVWGMSEHGALGFKTNLEKVFFIQKPVRLTFGEYNKLKQIACGFGFTIFLTKNYNVTQQVFGCGINSDSQIGYHAQRRGHPLELIYNPLPILIPPEANNIISIAAGRAHTLLLTDTGQVYSLGNNSHGQCGRTIIPDENYKGSQIVHHVKNLPPVQSLECGIDHSLFLTKDGKVFSCGLGSDGQTGHGVYETQAHAKLVGENSEFSQKKVIKISSKGDCVLALTDTGEVYGWGNNEYAQIVGTEEIQSAKPNKLKLNVPGKIVDIAAGGSFCLILNDQGNVYTWGYGLVGLGPAADQVLVPTLIPPPLFGSPISKIAAGLAHSAAITEKGQLFMWGRNTHGQLGLGHRKNQPFPLMVSIAAQVVNVSLGVDHTATLCRSFI